MQFLLVYTLDLKSSILENDTDENFKNFTLGSN